MFTYNNNYYTATMHETTQRAAAGRQCSQADVCIIGAGLAGLSTAWELVSRGKSVVLLEAGRVAWGASGRNGGFVLQGWSEGLSAIERRCGKPTAAALFKLSLEGSRHRARHDHPSSVAWLRANARQIERGSLRGWR
jgi:gamma-glutamylputrescine oxidase